MSLKFCPKGSCYTSIIYKGTIEKSFKDVSAMLDMTGIN